VAPRVSIIIPTWNRRHHVVEAIDSVLAQTYTDYEIIVVDDGSTDGTSDLLAQRYRGRPLTCIIQQNRGSSAARNAGIRAARGELLAFLDSDDLWLPRKLESQVPRFDRNPAVGFVFCGSSKVNERGVPVETREPTPEYRGHAVRAMLRRSMMPTPTVMIRSRLVPETGYMYEDLAYGEDWNYWLRIAARCEVDFVPEVLVHYREVAGGLSGIDFEAFRKSELAAIEALFRDPPTAKLFEPYRNEAWSQAHALVAAEALAKGRFDLARQESWHAIRLHPANREAWRILPRALLGSRALGVLRRLRNRGSLDRRA
jgi:glycosyltransferase involved in cell wall biosynthesis